MITQLPMKDMPSYRARWAPVFIEPIAGSGERLTVGIVLVDEQGREVRRVIRDDVLKSLYGSKRAHLSQMIEAVLGAIRDQDIGSEMFLPLSGFTLGSWREASSQLERYGIFRQAVYRTSSLASFLDLDAQDEDPVPQDGATKHWFRQIQQQVVHLRPELAAAFNQEVKLISDGLPPRVGFLFRRRGANFETLRPNALPATVRAARGRLFELVKIKKHGELDRGALVLGVPRQDDLTYPEKALHIVQRALLELKHEAEEDGISVNAAHTVGDAVEHILTLAA